MKKSVLKLLLEHQHAYISGEEISRIIGVSRTAVWKHINALKKEGYVIDSVHSQGYRLLSKPDIITTEELQINLLGDFICDIHIYEELSSTNEVAKKFAAEGAPEGTIVFADKQTKGRGRMGRLWDSKAGIGIWLSLVLRPSIMPAQAAQLTFVSAVVVCQAVRDFTGLEAGIKWPNDVMIKGKKICGILTELSAEIDRINYCVAGIGLNVNHQLGDFSTDIVDKATSLMLASGTPYRRLELLVSILTLYDRIYREYREKGFSYILEQWKKLNCTLGHEVKVISQEEVYFGTAIDIDADGQLMVKIPEGEVRYVIVGDVSIRYVQ
ncbi:MAG: biotin--[acetyl-CoA-carboxylase] ligase [Firmicutes bacterium HGW-Firmicutes-12]|jgi:BirA family biotin operon repressor/biotin-[acetyl-CoA-carboxylase] ligase|nr:MAG: biotin--[acetyl-CoA-carboxylase] ligase [Firmicutes bacterium HGW-Firmicutes-12]